MDDNQGRFSVAELQHQKATDFVFIYANIANLAATFYDLQIVFGQVTPPDNFQSSGPPHVKDMVAVTMAWEHAKALAKSLTQAVQNYEKEQNTTVREIPQSAPRQV
jgi:hypothetical protein